MVEAEGPTGNLSQAADRQKELVKPELHTPDASVPMEAAESELVPSLSLQQSGEEKGRAKTAGHARPQLWQVGFCHLCFLYLETTYHYQLPSSTIITKYLYNDHCLYQLAIPQIHNWQYRLVKPA